MESNPNPKSVCAINERLEALLAEMYAERGIQYGDISPEQMLLWDELAEKFAKLFDELIKQNSGNYLDEEDE